MLRSAIGIGTTSVSVNLLPPPGAGFGAGPQNIKVWSLHGYSTGAGTAGNMIVSVLYSSPISVPDTLAWRCVKAHLAASSGSTTEIVAEFPQGLVLPAGDGAQFEVRFTAPTGSTNTVINVTYEHTSEAS